VLEQDHHFLQQLTKQGVEFKFFTLGLENPIKGYEAMNMLRRGQVIGVLKGDGQAQLNFMAQILEVAA